MKSSFLYVLLGFASLAAARSVIDPIPVHLGEDTNGLCAQKQCPAGYTCKLLPKIDCKENCELFAECIAPNVVLNETSNVAITLANATNVKCGENEELKVCGSECEPKCGNSGPQACTLNCVPNVCQCKVGFYRDVNTNKCVTLERCPQISPMPLTCANILCPPGKACKQETINCIRAPCPQPRPQCVDSNSTVNPCTTITCLSGQVCQLKKVQCFVPPCDPFPECVYENNTGNTDINKNLTCKANEHVDNCGGCEGTCEQKMKPCTLACNPPACVCNPGFYRHNGVCVPENQCPVTSGNKSCGINEELKTCGTACEPSCAKQDVQICTEQCIVNVCQCKKDFYRNAVGQCVPKDQCTKIPQVTCDTVKCSAGFECKIVNVFCKKLPCPPKAECVPVNSTATCKKECPNDQQCALESLMCINPPCGTVERCIPLEGIDAKCETLDCRDGYHCIEQTVPCLIAPCPVRAKCVNFPTCETARLKCHEGEQCGMKNGVPSCVPTCAKNETWTDCSSCEEQCNVPTRLCPASCGQPKCQCSPGYTRDLVNGNCVLLTDCPKTGEVEPDCALVDCASGLRCEVKTLQCLVPPCPKAAQCVPTGGASCATVKCSAGFACEMENGVPKCLSTSPSSCAATSCITGTDCIEEPIPCLIAPCPVRARCVAATTSKPSITCANVRIKCKEGYQCGMRNGGPTCVPIPGQLCAVTDCEAGNRCEEVEVKCLMPPCPVRAVCVPNNSTSCRKNETWKECSSCDAVCGQPDLMCPAVCGEPRCQCNVGFARDNKGNCIRKKDCPKNGTTSACATALCAVGTKCIEEPMPCLVAPCPVQAKCVASNSTSCSKNETWKDCSGCEASCGLSSIMCPAVCEAAKCQCNVGFVRDRKGKCIRIQDCPKNGTSTSSTPTPTSCYGFKCKNGQECEMRNGKPRCVSSPVVDCPTNEVWDSCGGCEGTCNNTSPMCAMNCRKGACVCANGMVRQNGKCVALNECKVKDRSQDPRCAATEVWNDCKPSCEDTCSGHACTNSTITSCTPGCTCKPYYKRDADGECRHARQCYKNPGCDYNEEWHQCLPCEKKCSDGNNAVCNKKCYSGCGCKDGYARNNYGYCVDEDFGCLF